MSEDLRIRCIPATVIFLALGGYTQKRKGKPVSEDTAKVLQELEGYLKKNKVAIIYDGEKLDWINYEVAKPSIWKRIFGTKQKQRDNP